MPVCPEDIVHRGFREGQLRPRAVIKATHNRPVPVRIIKPSIKKTHTHTGL